MDLRLRFHQGGCGATCRIRCQMTSRAMEDFDPSVRNLIDELNAFPGVVTSNIHQSDEYPVLPVR